jgi:hypothetical protein
LASAPAAVKFTRSGAVPLRGFAPTWTVGASLVIVTDTVSDDVAPLGSVTVTSASNVPGAR